MKILVISLLRLGDIILQGPLLKGLRAQYPQAEIHLLINRQFSQVEGLLEGVVDRFIYFDREGIQKGLGEPGYNIRWSYDQVDALVHSLNLEKYDRALNFTHNRLSGYLLGAIDINDKRGLFFEKGRFQGLSNQWIRFFNDRFSSPQPSLFHYVEILGKAFGIPLRPMPLESREPRKKSKMILMQCLTSDTKKNWGLQNFAQLKKTIEVALVDYKVLILGAPFEQEKLLEVFSASELLICDLIEARDHIERADLLVTGDTSIKHLAAQVGVPVVEIAIGSSDASKTAAFSERASLVTSSVPCAPCKHSQACYQKSHLCASDVSIETVFEAVWGQLTGVTKVPKNLERVFNRMVWTLYLDKSSAEVGVPYGAAVTEIESSTSNTERESYMPQWLEIGRSYQNWLQKIRASLPSRDVLAGKKGLETSDVAELVACAQEILKTQKDSSGYFQGFIEVLMARFNHPVQLHDRISAALVDIEELLTIRETLTRRLQTHSMEGAFYAKGIGQLSVPGFEEAGSRLPENLGNSGLQSRGREAATS